MVARIAAVQEGRACRGSSQNRLHDLLAILLRGRFNLSIPFQVLGIDLEEVAHGHFPGLNGVLAGGLITEGFFQVGQAQLGDRKDIGLEALANQLAFDPDSGKVGPRLLMLPP